MFDVRRSSDSFLIRLAVFWPEALLICNYAKMARFLYCVSGVSTAKILFAPGFGVFDFLDEEI